MKRSVVAALLLSLLLLGEPAPAERAKKRIALAITIENSPSHEYSTDTLRGIAARLLRDLP